MKQNVNPAVIAVIAVVVLGILGFFGWRMLQPAIPAAGNKAAAATSVETINGHKVTADVPADYLERYKQSKGQGTPP